MKRFSLLSLLSVCLTLHAQEPIQLWTDSAPGALGTAPKDIPTLTPFLVAPERASGAAMLICPGGGYGALTAREGNDYARWFNSKGIAGFVLKYRLGNTNGYHHPVPWQDATRAIRLIRARAEEWKIDPRRIGVIGSSAGGHLASTLLTHWDTGAPNATDPVEKQSSRPDLGILCYAVISTGPHIHTGSFRNLLGESPPADSLRFLSSELHVNSQTPPCFIWHTGDDQVVKVENSLVFAQALRQAGVPFDLHIYANGPHGLALGSRDPQNPREHPWLEDLTLWLKTQDFIR